MSTLGRILRQGTNKRNLQLVNERFIANSLIEKPESERKELASRTDRVRGTERGFITASDLLFPAHDIDPQAPSDI